MWCAEIIQRVTNKQPLDTDDLNFRVTFHYLHSFFETGTAQREGLGG